MAGKGRPRIYYEQRVTTNVRLPRSLHARLAEVAGDRDVSINLIITRAITEFLDQLRPADEVLTPPVLAQRKPGSSVRSVAGRRL